MNQKYILGIFSDEVPVLDAVRALRASGSSIHDVYSPFPIHGLDEALGLKRSRLPKAAFLFGVTGLSLSVLMQAWMLGIDWPMNIGGKPALAWPDFVPVSFEITVLLTALGMVATYFYACGFFPGAIPKQPDIRITNDKFCIAINSEGADQAAVEAVLRLHGAEEVKVEEVEL
jgi:hypothetical protein